MNTKSIFAIATVLTLMVAASSGVSIAFADPLGEGGPKDEFNNGQYKQEFNDNVCKKFHTGSD
jgi:hypothetical protein